MLLLLGADSPSSFIHFSLVSPVFFIKLLTICSCNGGRDDLDSSCTSRVRAYALSDSILKRLALTAVPCRLSVKAMYLPHSLFASRPSPSSAGATVPLSQSADKRKL